MAELAKARMAWQGSRDHAVAELRRLQAALPAEFGEDEAQAAALQAALARLGGLAARLDAALEADLDLLLNEAEEGRRGPPREAARAGIAALSSLLDSDPILGELGGNELLAVAPLRADLAALQAAL